MRIVLALFLVLAACPTTARSLLTSPDGPWWVVIGSFANPDTTTFQTKAVAAASAAARRCGLEPFNDFSGKFAGFQPGYDVVVVGGFRSRGDANDAVMRLRPCSPGTFVKRGWYLGE